MSDIHEYELKVQWTGNTGRGTKSYTGYSRNHTVVSNGKQAMTDHTPILRTGLA